MIDHDFVQKFFFFFEFCKFLLFSVQRSDMKTHTHWSWTKKTHDSLLCMQSKRRKLAARTHYCATFEKSRRKNYTKNRRWWLSKLNVSPNKWTTIHAKSCSAVHFKKNKKHKHRRNNKPPHHQRLMFNQNYYMNKIGCNWKSVRFFFFNGLNLNHMSVHKSLW